MQGTIRQLTHQVGRGLTRTWEHLAEGWRELLGASQRALTHFVPRKQAGTNAFPSWGLLPGEIEDEGKSLVVRLELPGMDKQDLDITFDANSLCVRGEKRVESETVGSSYYLMERAYGSFERVIPLPVQVDADKAEASLKRGVLTIRLPKANQTGQNRIAVR